MNSSTALCSARAALQRADRFVQRIQRPQASAHAWHRSRRDRAARFRSPSPKDAWAGPRPAAWARAGAGAVLAARPSSARQSRTSRVSGASASSSFRPRVSCSSRCSQREAVVGAPSTFSGAGQQHAWSRRQHGKVMRGKPDAALGLLQAQRRAHGTREPGIGARAARPGAFVQSAQHRQIETLQARFQRTQDRKARMAAEGGAHRHLHGEAAEQRRVGAGLDCRQVRGSPDSARRRVRPPVRRPSPRP